MPASASTRANWVSVSIFLGIRLTRAIRSGVLSSTCPDGVAATDTPSAARQRDAGRSGCSRMDIDSAPNLPARPLLARRRAGCFRQGLVDIGQDVVDMLEPDGKPHVVLRHAGRELVLRRELRMRCARRVDGEAARVADIGDVIEELQRIDEAPARLASALELEADQPAEA